MRHDAGSIDAGDAATPAQPGVSRNGAGCGAIPGRAGLLLLLSPAMLLVACDGPNEKAGREKDKAAAAAAGVPYRGDGPNERIGEAQDRIADAAKDARDAQAKQLREQARGIKAEADAQADRLEQQAAAVREQARHQAAPLEDQARAVRQQQ